MTPETENAPAAATTRWFMTLAYDGAPFHGWQVQPDAVSVQSVLEDALTKLFRRPTPVTGAGRTDAGVNARRMTAHFDTAGPIDDTAGLVRRINAIVGRSIAVDSIRRVRPDAHARFDATARTYRYFAHTVKSPFLDRFSWMVRNPLDFDLMNEAAAQLVGRHDFTSFSKLHTDTVTNICTVDHALWRPCGPDGQWEFEITADRFLRNMVRAVVGTLVDVGRGKLSLDGFSRVIEQRDRCAAGTSMPGNALFLWDVVYPESVWDD